MPMALAASVTLRTGRCRITRWLTPAAETASIAGEDMTITLSGRGAAAASAACPRRRKETAAADEDLARADLATVGRHLDALDLVPVLAVVRRRRRPVDAFHADHQRARPVQVVLLRELDHLPAGRRHRHVLTLFTCVSIVGCRGERKSTCTCICTVTGRPIPGYTKGGYSRTRPEDKEVQLIWSSILDSMAGVSSGGSASTQSSSIAIA